MAITGTKICLIITGATVLEDNLGQLKGIQSKEDIKEWLHSMPELVLLADELHIELLHQGKDADVTGAVWKKAASYIYEHSREFIGFIIFSSIDNIPFFAHALTLILQNPDFPIIFTGSQLPDYLLKNPQGFTEIQKVNEDVGIRTNVINAIHVVRHSFPGVFVIFGDKLITGLRLRLKRPFLNNPFEYSDEQVVGNVEFSIKLRPFFENKFQPTESKKPMLLMNSLEENVRYFEIGPSFHAIDILHELKGARGAIFRIPNTVSYPRHLMEILKERTDKFPVVFFGEFLMIPEGLTDTAAHEELEKEGVILMRGGSLSWVLPTFMWILGQTNDLNTIKPFFV